MAASRSQYFDLPRDTVADASARTRDADMSSADDPRTVVGAEDVAMAPAGAQPVPSDPPPGQAMVPAGIAPVPEGGAPCTDIAPWVETAPSPSVVLRSTLRSRVPDSETMRDDVPRVATDERHDIPGIPSAMDFLAAASHRTSDGLPEYFKAGDKVRLPPWAHALAPGCKLLKKVEKLSVLAYAWYLIHDPGFVMWENDYEKDWKFCAACGSSPKPASTIDSGAERGHQHNAGIHQCCGAWDSWRESFGAIM